MTASLQKKYYRQTEKIGIEKEVADFALKDKRKNPWLVLCCVYLSRLVLESGIEDKKDLIMEVWRG